ncbi:GNAT family N-acetyltransferase [Planctobacterium marinum]|uniref:N-acetyltransferase domain-containing protein n=1 Tax=Planctobacterium marinum TaxID=1631968 RepID=A0AA48KVR4_9ALTE|nr:hypothetical protein MACH26_33110 [Planctobacterium marinum]
MGVKLCGYGVDMVPVASHHLELLRQWRNSNFVRQQMVSNDHISGEQQLRWFDNICLRNDQVHFVIQYKGEAIGSANLKALCGNSVEQANRLEPGIYIGDERYHSNILAFAPSLLLLDYCFDDLGVKQLFAKVKINNQAALNYNHKLGYREVDKDGEYVFITLDYERYLASTVTLKKLFSRQAK